jgi:subtilisin family serine protease
MGLRSLSALGAFAVVAAMLLAVTASGAPGGGSTKTYIVQMLQAPAVAYEGGVAGLAATKPGKGEKINPNSAAVKKYADYLVEQHGAALQKVGGAERIYDFKYTYNGFAAELTAGQATALQKVADVLAVTEEEIVTADTSSTPAFLGLDAPGGLWSQLGGPTAGKLGSGAGEDIVIGVIDSGIWPENPSFSDRDASGKTVYNPINTSKWHGRKCTPGEQFTASLCNNKLVGGQHFNASWGGDAALEALRPWEFMSVRDYNGHGSHTASTSGGNAGVQTTGPATVFGKVSGIAPRARIAAYKALWSTQDSSTASGQTGDLLAAIDQAVADGVDVINYSISGSQTNFLDPVMVAYLFAADAGVFVSTSAGNSGPTVSTVAHPGPWVTTVAAGTHNRDGKGSVTLGNGVTYNGASVATAVGPAGLIDATAAGLAGADAVKVELCYGAADNAGAAVLDAAKVKGKIVICKRGVTARVNKSLAVQQAGGVGMVLYNDPDSSLNADFHFVPSVHVTKADGLAIKAYAALAGPTAKINASTIVFNAPAPFTASFSSRGPLQAGGGDLLKPDVIAPGQDILAAVAPPGAAGREFNLLSGTSMSAPHVAGLAALLKQKYPGWSPMAIKSALMTSAGDILDGPNTNPLVIFRQGAGHVQPNKAANPGLVFDSSWNDWLAFLCGTTTGVNPASCTALKTAGYSTDPSDMNVASIAIGDLAGIQTVTRKVTNVSGTTATFNAAVTGMTGITTVVSPASLTLAAGATGTFKVTFTRTAAAALNAYTGGQLTWSNATHSVRIPLVIRPVALAAPAEVAGTGAPITYSVTFGYDGPFAATARGLIPATTEKRTVKDDATDSTCSLTSPNAQIHDVAIPAGTTYARFSLFDAFTDGEDDLDLCVFLGTTNVGSSGSGTSAEQVNLVNPAAGAYKVVVQGWGTDGPDAEYTLFHWLLGSTSAGNMAVTAPVAATTGGTGSVNLTFSGLVPATKYLGSVAYSGVAGLPNPTIVRVDTP